MKEKVQEKTVEQFFKVRRAPKTKEVVVSEVFKDENGKPIPWTIQALSIEQIQAVAKASMVNGQLDVQKNQVGMITASVISPNLRNAELQDYFEVMTEEALLKAMLLPVEYAKLYEAIVELNEIKTEAEMVEEAKNF